MSNVANELAAADAALPPEMAARVIYRGLFENGPQRLSAVSRAIATGVIATALTVWRKQLLAANEGEGEKWKKMYKDAKAELDDVRLRLAILQKEK